MDTDAENRPAAARLRVQGELGHLWGAAVFLRIVKEQRLLELHLRQGEGGWQLFRRYPIAGMSGTLGPKTREGDMQAPEGFYEVLPTALNPRSAYHLSFNIGYPNAYDRRLERTGSLIMIHGGEKSAGCFAMTDARIEEIYTLVEEAFAAGQRSIPVQIYPFAMTSSRMEQEATSPHYTFWQQHLLPGWLHTEATGAPYTPS